MTFKRSLLLPLLLLGACGSASDRLLGSWVMDVATLNLSPHFRELDQSQKENVIGQTRWNLEFTKTRLKWDHAMYGWGAEKWEAAYTVKETEGNRATLEVDRPGKRPGKKMKLVVTVTDERLQFSVQGRSIILKRKVA